MNCCGTGGSAAGLGDGANGWSGQVRAAGRLRHASKVARLVVDFSAGASCGPAFPRRSSRFGRWGSLVRKDLSAPEQHVVSREQLAASESLRPTRTTAELVVGDGVMGR